MPFIDRKLFIFAHARIAKSLEYHPLWSLLVSVQTPAPAPVRNVLVWSRVFVYIVIVYIRRFHFYYIYENALPNIQKWFGNGCDVLGDVAEGLFDHWKHPPIIIKDHNLSNFGTRYVNRLWSRRATCVYVLGVIWNSVGAIYGVT